MFDFANGSAGNQLVTRILYIDLSVKNPQRKP